ncbi:MAG: 50S ribosomal protein L11 methyltransferase [Lachnospiraceae bacterium]|jgi:ribosomal protein L11 methyltransferase|nr:50S ribosomal protein L11 methyltransferase [Lachnospiraceae bacterium]
MKWMRFRVRTRTEAEDILISFMEDIGLSGAQIEDNVPLTAAEKEQMFVDILPEGPADDGTAVLSFFLEETEDGKLVVDETLQTPEEVREKMTAKIEEIRAFCDVGEGTVTIDETEDIDWINNWKQYFHQFWIDDVLVIPSWEEPEKVMENGREKVPGLVFHIDPGTAFGTGMHETTQLCIRELRKYITPDTVLLDVGTGSGILALLALKLGIRSAVGTDLDPCAAPAIEDNIAANGVDPALFKVILGNLIDDPEVQKEVGEERYDVVLANILPDVLIPLTPQAVRCMKPGAVYITSGILIERAESVKEAMRAAGLEVTGMTEQGEWCCVVGRKKA